jgi:hypothetical protein
MRTRLRRQLVLQLDAEAKPPLVVQNSPELVQALAELLLEALEGDRNEDASAEGGRNESEDHA